MNGHSDSTRIECWSRVELIDGFTGVVTQITEPYRSGRSASHGTMYHIAGEKLRCVPRREIKRKILTLNPLKP